MNHYVSSEFFLQPKHDQLPSEFLGRCLKHACLCLIFNNDRLIDQGAQVLVLLEWMLPLSKQLPLQLATKNCSAVPVHSIDEVLAGDADRLSFPIDQLSLFDERLALHH